jgi:hypothetical protein
MDQVKKTPVVLVLFAWLFVSLPWAWGVDQLWKNARKLFAAPPAVTTPVPAATALAAPAGSPAPAAPAK